MSAKVKTTKKRGRPKKEFTFENDFDGYLFSKYPDLFPKDENGNLLPQSMRCWNDCPPGWEPIIDDLCNSINTYVNGYSRFVPNPKRKISRFFWNLWNKISRKFYYKSKIRQLGNKFFYKYIGNDLHIKESPPPVRVDQYKTKFGHLRFYFDGGDDMVDGMVYFAEILASKTCPNTGKRKK